MPAAAPPPPLAYVPPICFDADCAANADRAFLAALAVPLVAAAAIAAWVLRPPPRKLVESGRVFEDPDTGTMFEAPEGVAPEVDGRSLLAFKPVSYTPFPVEADAPGERVRVWIGKAGATEPRTFVVEKLLPRPSEIVAVTLPRPLGIVFSFDEAQRRAVVSGFVEGGNAEQRRKVARLNKDKAAEAALEGDVLRAVTCTCPVWPTKALFGVVAPERHIVLYGADQAKGWGAIRTALRRGESRDGPVTLVLERGVVED